MKNKLILLIANLLVIILPSIIGCTKYKECCDIKLTNLKTNTSTHTIECGEPGSKKKAQKYLEEQHSKDYYKSNVENRTSSCTLEKE